MTDIVFMDTETLGLDINAPIWEFAAIRRSPRPEADETMPMFGADPDPWIEEELHLFIQHDPDGWLDELPDSFANDYRGIRSARGRTGTPCAAGRPGHPSRGTTHAINNGEREGIWGGMTGYQRRAFTTGTVSYQDCPECGAEFIPTGPGQVFCSRKCSATSRHRRTA